mmetsp:Transcript_2525/g.16655  ORF Transcript_2525/g.16655 Transcript_2525/m.16655 type:complete len:226 (-) Transcript_2525:1433-2110(-)
MALSLSMRLPSLDSAFCLIKTSRQSMNRPGRTVTFILSSGASCFSQEPLFTIPRDGRMFCSLIPPAPDQSLPNARDSNACRVSFKFAPPTDISSLMKDASCRGTWASGNCTGFTSLVHRSLANSLTLHNRTRSFLSPTSGLVSISSMSCPAAWAMAARSIPAPSAFSSANVKSLRLSTGLATRTSVSTHFSSDGMFSLTASTANSRICSKISRICLGPSRSTTMM